MEKVMIEKTGKYLFDQVSQKKGESFYFSTGNSVRTFFIHKGEATFNKKNSLDGVVVKEGQGLLLPPETDYHLKTDEGYFGVQVTSKIKNYDVVEIIDDGKNQREEPIKNYKLIENPKKVSKPWGHELWISWIKDVHVLKQIGMIAGKKSSLQLHRDKIETNYLVEGEADFLNGYEMDMELTENEMKEKIRSIDLTKYISRKKVGNGFSAFPGTVHRVISKKDYIAYEASSTELDDVIRLSDVTGRESGRIVSEHK